MRRRGDSRSPRELVALDDLDQERVAQLRRQARRGAATEGLVRALEPPLLVGRELGRAREVDLADAARTPPVAEDDRLGLVCGVIHRPRSGFCSSKCTRDSYV